MHPLMHFQTIPEYEMFPQLYLKHVKLAQSESCFSL